MRRFGSQVERSITDKHWILCGGVLTAAAGRMESAAVVFNAARDRTLTAQLSPKIAKQVNATTAIRQWFPSVNEAIRLGDESVVERKIGDLVKRFDSATQVLESATRLLRGS